MTDDFEPKIDRINMAMVEIVRKAMGYSVYEMAEKINISNRTYRKWVDKHRENRAPIDVHNVVVKMMQSEGIETYDDAHRLYEERKKQS